MSRTIARGEIDLGCNIGWRIVEWDNGDVETIVDVTSENIPHGMTEAIQEWIEATCDGVDWVIARPRNRKPAAERIDDGKDGTPNRAGVPASGR